MKKFFTRTCAMIAALMLAHSAHAQQSMNGIRLQDASGHVVTISGPSTGFTGNYNFRFPSAVPAAGAMLYSSDGAGQSSWLPAGAAGDVLTYTGGLPVWSNLATLLSGLSTSWIATGNAPLLAYNGLLGSFLGTTNNQPLVLATTNILSPQPIEFFAGNSEKMRLTANGELGIGVTPTAGKLLQVNGTAGTSNVRFTSIASATGSTGRLMFAADATGDLGSLAFPASAGLVLTSSTTGALSWTAAGSVSSVGLTVPSIFSVSPATITTSGTFAVTLASQATGNQIFASPNGAAGTPAFRTMVLGDLPQIASNTILGNNTAGSAVPTALTTAQVKTLLNLTGTNSGDVSLSGTGTYLSLSGQTITQNPIDLSTTNATGILAAARHPALTGDVTSVAGSLATTISNNAVTYVKMQAASSTAKLVGSSSGSTALGEITLGNGLSMAGSTLSTSTTTGLFARKTADATYSANAALTPDGDLSVALAANAVYEFSGVIAYNGANVNSDLQIAMNIPAGATIRWNVNQPGTAFASSSVTGSGGTTSAISAFHTDATPANNQSIFISGIVIVAGTAGNLQVYEAQATSSATNTTTVLQNSFVRAIRVQ